MTSLQFSPFVAYCGLHAIKIMKLNGKIFFFHLEKNLREEDFSSSSVKKPKDNLNRIK